MSSTPGSEIMICTSVVGPGAPVKQRTRNIPGHKGSDPAGEALIGTEARAISLVGAIGIMELRSSCRTTRYW